MGANAHDIPTELRLACGHDVPHAVGTRIFNYYDMRAGDITVTARLSDPDTSGTMPGGRTYWVETTAGYVDGSRMICMDCAKRKGWVTS